MAVGHSTSLEYSRDNSGDLVWNSSTESYTSSKPEHLYAWTDSNITGTQLYAWTYGDDYATFWTDTPTPTTSSNIYDEDGTDLTSTYVHGECGISSVTSNSITYAAAIMSPIPIGVETGKPIDITFPTK